jgi:hypothetical protein
MGDDANLEKTEFYQEVAPPVQAPKSAAPTKTLTPPVKMK